MARDDWRWLGITTARGFFSMASGGCFLSSLGGWIRRLTYALRLSSCACGSKCECASRPECCVNKELGIAYFYSKSHWLPVTPLSFSETIT